MPRSKSGEPTLSIVALESRCSTLASKIARALGISSDKVYCTSETANAQAVIGLAGRSSELIERNAGQKHRVIQLCRLSDDVFAWVGFRERWQRIGRERHMRFLDVGFTIHVGREGELIKPQIFRSEWVGVGGRNGRDQVGHPHWQIDIVDTVRRKRQEDKVGFGGASKVYPRSGFDNNGKLDQSENFLLSVPIEKIHFASAAPWWEKGEVMVANAPNDIPALDRWIVGCISYLRQEVARCGLQR